MSTGWIGGWPLPQPIMLNPISKQIACRDWITNLLPWCHQVRKAWPTASVGTRKQILSASAILIVCLLTLKWQIHSSFAQTEGGSQWSTPQRIPDYFNLLNAPLLVADSDRTAHAFDLESDDAGSFNISYRTWSPGRGWSEPVAILLPAFLGIAPSLQDVALDSRGFFNLVYYGGTPQTGVIYYTTALASRGGLAQEWSPPVAITEDAGPQASARIVDAGSGQLVVVYSGSRYGIGLYEMHSLDFGATWSPPVLVYRSTSSDLFPGEIRTERVAGSGIHVVWHMVNTSGQAEETWYGHLDEDLSTWDEVQALSKRATDIDFNGYPSLLALDNQLMAVYYDSFPPTRFMRRSTDNGKTWSLPVRLFPYRGGYGQAAMVKDSVGVGHMVLGNRSESPEIHGMWYSTWNGTSWSALIPIISGPSSSTFDPTLPEVVVVQGNILLAAWSNNVGVEGRTGAWYAYRTLDAPELRLTPLPLPSPTQVITPSPTRPPSPTPTPEPTLAPLPPNIQSGSAGLFGESPVTLILIGMVPVILIILGLLFWLLAKRTAG